MTPSAFFDALGEKAAESWITAVRSPSLLFWAAGLLAWVFDEGGWNDSGQRLVDWFTALTGVEQVLVAIGALLLVVVTDAVVGFFTLPVLRLLEGYYLLHRLSWLTDYEKRRRDRAARELEPLWEKLRESTISPQELITLGRNAQFVRRFPVDPAHFMPTRLGNVLRAGETWSRDKYGLDSIICWPRLWLVLDPELKAELTEARRQLDRTVELLIWGVLIACWLFLTPWILIVAACTVGFAYWWVVQRAKVQSDYVEATYDVHRFALYDALRLPRPKRPLDEAGSGLNLTGYLWWRKPQRAFNEIEFVPEHDDA